MEANPRRLWDANNNHNFLDQFNWEISGVLHAATNQRQFPFCWAHSVALSISALLRIMNMDVGRFPRRLSPQYLIYGCSSLALEDLEDSSCSGYRLHTHKALRWVVHNGICEEVNLPYIGWPTSRPNPDKTDYNFWGITDYGRVYSEGDLEGRVENQPVVATMIVDESFPDVPWDLRSEVYEYPLFTEHDYHAIVVVGWGIQRFSRFPYWIVRSSYGSDWGIDGSVRIRRNVGLLFDMVYPIIHHEL